MGEFLVGVARNPNDQLIRSQVICIHAWRTMSSASVSSQEALSELSGWETSLLGPQKENQSCHIFANTTLPFALHVENLLYFFTFVRIEASAFAIFSHEVQQ